MSTVRDLSIQFMRWFLLITESASLVAPPMAKTKPNRKRTAVENPKTTPIFKRNTFPEKNVLEDAEEVVLEETSDEAAERQGERV